MSNDTFATLQDLQREFDSTHGLEGIDAVVGSRGHKSLSAKTGAAAFAALALAGECGEVANSIKKALRAQHLDREAKVHLDIAKEELADVLAYLLKLANVLETDLVEEYLQTVALNSLRFALPKTKKGPRVVGLAGFDNLVVEGIATEIALAKPSDYVLELSKPPSLEAGRISSWVIESGTQLEATLGRQPNANTVLVRHDPAFHAHWMSSRASAPQHVSQIPILQALIGFERIVWNRAQSRSLLVIVNPMSDMVNSESVKSLLSKLAAHGANIEQYLGTGRGDSDFAKKVVSQFL
jgi:NTP pyrophosphatase (non-canonical NTP hydrolase)